MVQLKRQQQELRAMQNVATAISFTTFIVGAMVGTSLGLATKNLVTVRH
jgi:hypothetical protein